MIIMLLTAATITANAQTVARADQAVNTKAPVSEMAATPVVTGNNNSKVAYANQDAMSFINMRMKGNWAYFENIDGLGVIKVYVSNAGGREMFTRKVSGKSNAVDMSTLSKGMYFITLINENTDSRKAFTLNL